MSTPVFSTKPSGTIAPGFLVASPKLDDSPFERAVVAMIQHDDEGAMGFILNKPLEIDFGSLIESVNDEIVPHLRPESFDQPVHFGGPVRIEQLWMIFQRDIAGEEDSPANQHLLRKIREPGDGALTFCDGWYLAASGDLIEGFAMGRQHGAYRPFIGYAGWGPGQLEAEIEDGSWLMLDFDDDFLFESKANVHWDRALERLGVDPTAFLMMAKSGMA